MPKLEITNPAAKFLYASFCAGCEPAVQSLSYDYVSVKSFAELLKEYPENKALIIIRTDSGKEINKQRSYQNALELAADFRKNLTENYKISSQKITIKIGKPAGQESPMTVDFYIVPDNKKPKRF